MVETLAVDTHVKYSQFDHKQNDATKSKRPFAAERLNYNEQDYYYVHPMGQDIHNMGTHSRITSTDFAQ